MRACAAIVEEGRHMGKGARLRRARAAERTDDTAGAPSRAEVALLLEAVVAVGDAFGTRPKCAEAAAVLQGTARLLGYTLVPRPVSVLIHHEPSDTWAFMGPKASALIPLEGRPGVEDHRPGGQDNGHLVLTCDDPRFLLDPNLRQLRSYGIEAPSLAVRIASVEPTDGSWSVDHDGLRLQYILDEDNRVLLERYDELLQRYSSEAEYLARMLRAGASAADMRELLSSPS
jgi:hypothetical protein